MNELDLPPLGFPCETALIFVQMFDESQANEWKTAAKDRLAWDHLDESERNRLEQKLDEQFSPGSFRDANHSLWCRAWVKNSAG